MSYQRVFGKLVCKCDRRDKLPCNRVWISESGVMPERCAGCKRHGWNTQQLAQDALQSVGVRESMPEASERPTSRNSMDSLLHGSAGEPEPSSDDKGWVEDEYSQ